MSLIKPLVIALVASIAFALPAFAADTTARELTSRPDLPLKVKDNGDGTYSMGQSVALASGLPVAATTTTTNSTVAVANTYQSALAANPARKGCLIVNKGLATLLVYVGAPGSATAAQSVILAAGTATADGGTFNCGLVQTVVVTDQISVTSATLAQAYLVMSQ